MELNFTLLLTKEKSCNARKSAIPYYLRMSTSCLALITLDSTRQSCGVYFFLVYLGISSWGYQSASPFFPRCLLPLERFYRSTTCFLTGEFNLKIMLCSKNSLNQYIF